jgi:cation:H+ antiporter
MLPYILLIIGFVFMIKGADFLVKGASSMARRFNISDLVISLTVVAVGTSLPELATSAVAAYRKNVDIAVGNVVGSNVLKGFEPSALDIQKNR